MGVSNLYVGKRLQNKRGDWFTIVEVRNSLNVTVEFDERGVRKTTSANNVERGAVALPKYYVGQTVLSSQGEPVKIVEIKSSSEVTFEWEDGERATRQSSCLSLNTLVRPSKSRKYNFSLAVGDTFKNTQGSEYVVVECNSSRDILVEFREPVIYQVRTGMGNVKAGHITNKWLPSLVGFGILGNFNESAKSPIYLSYAGMLKRGVPNPTQPESYKECSVCNEWRWLDNYAKWFKEQKYEKGWELDKDLLFRGNKVYSPETCVFLPQEINCFMTDRHNHRGRWPLGVTYHARLNKWQASCNVRGQSEYLGVFLSPESAFEAYKEVKEGFAKELATEWRGRIDEKAFTALFNYTVSIDD